MKYYLNELDNINSDLFRRNDLINYLINLYDYKSYLEIGVAEGGNFVQIDCEKKIGVDPYDAYPEITFMMPSDEFFNNNTDMFDIIFIDGLHQKTQVIKDIENSLKFLNPKGTIVMHDCLPYSEASQMEEPWSAPIWLGNVWEAFAHYRQDPSLFMMTLDTDHGLGFIKKGSQQTYELPEKLDYQYFIKNRQSLMNVTSCYEALEIIKNLHDAGL